MFLAHPDAVKQVFTGDPRGVPRRRGATSSCCPSSAATRCCCSTSAAHMRAAQADAAAVPRRADAALRRADARGRRARDRHAGRPASRSQLWPRMQAVTLEVIMRAVFGVEEGERLERLRARARETCSTGPSTARRMVALALLGPQAASSRLGLFRRALEPVDELVLEEIAPAPRRPDLEERDDILSLLLQARHEDGAPMSDEELRDELMTLLVAGPRDHRHRRCPGRSSGWCATPRSSSACAEEAPPARTSTWTPSSRRRCACGRCCRSSCARLTEPVEIGGWHAARRASRSTPCIYLIHRRPDIYPEPHAFRPERFLEQPAGHLHLDPVRRRRAPLPRRELRACSR